MWKDPRLYYINNTALNSYIRKNYIDITDDIDKVWIPRFTCDEI